MLDQWNAAARRNDSIQRHQVIQIIGLYAVLKDLGFAAEGHGCDRKASRTAAQIAAMKLEVRAIRESSVHLSDRLLYKRWRGRLFVSSDKGFGVSRDFLSSAVFWVFAILNR